MYVGFSRLLQPKQVAGLHVINLLNETNWISCNNSVNTINQWVIIISSGSRMAKCHHWIPKRHLAEIIASSKSLISHFLLYISLAFNHVFWQVWYFSCLFGSKRYQFLEQVATTPTGKYVSCLVYWDRSSLALETSHLSITMFRAQIWSSGLALPWVPRLIIFQHEPTGTSWILSVIDPLSNSVSIMLVEQVTSPERWVFLIARPIATDAFFLAPWAELLDKLCKEYSFQ